MINRFLPTNLIIISILFLFPDAVYSENYCTARGNSVNYEWIGEVTFGDLNNSSGAAGYQDFANLNVRLEKGVETNFAVRPAFKYGSYPEWWAIFIDLNHDQDFNDSGERVFATSSGKSGEVRGTFTVPQGEYTGQTRMRIAMKYGGLAEACGTFSWGEVEDYTVYLHEQSDELDPSLILNNEELGMSVAGIKVDPDIAQNLQGEGEQSSGRISEVDVLVIYTSNAKNEYQQNGKNIDNEIDTAFTEANEALQSSQTNVRLFKTGALELPYEETNDSQDDALFLGNSAYVRAHREIYRADLVAFIVRTPGEGEGSGPKNGVALLRYEKDRSLQPLQDTSETHFLSLTRAAHSVSSYSFAHEIGHNLGAAHERMSYSNLNQQRLFDGASAHYIDGEISSVMATQEFCSSPCPRLPSFSNTNVNVTWQGQSYPMGSQSNRNADVVSHVAKEVENYRSRLRNYPEPHDVNNDGCVSPMDVLSIINFLNETGGSDNILVNSLPRNINQSANNNFDVSGDGYISPFDVLQVINYLNTVGNDCSY